MSMLLATRNLFTWLLVLSITLLSGCKTDDIQPDWEFLYSPEQGFNDHISPVGLYPMKDGNLLLVTTGFTGMSLFASRFDKQGVLLSETELKLNIPGLNEIGTFVNESNQDGDGNVYIYGFYSYLPDGDADTRRQHGGAFVLRINQSAEITWQMTQATESFGIQPFYYATAHNGEIYLAGQDIKVFASDGTLIRTLPHQAIYLTFDSQGYLYLSGGRGLYRKISQQGDLIWESQLQRSARSSSPIDWMDTNLLIGADGNLYSYYQDSYGMDTSYGRLAKFDGQTGARAWQRVFASPFSGNSTHHGAASFASDGEYIYTVNSNNSARVISKTRMSDGKVIWSKYNRNAFASQLLLDDSGNVYVGGENRINKYDRDGNLIYTIGPGYWSNNSAQGIVLDGIDLFSASRAGTRDRNTVHLAKYYKDALPTPQ